MEKEYAAALWEVVERGMKPKEAVSKLRETLGKHGRKALLPRVARAFARIASREEAKKAVTIIVANEKQAARALRAAEDALREIGVEAADIRVRVDESLVGGWRLEGRERLYDSSYKKSLLNIYNAVTNAIPRRSDEVGNRGPDRQASGYNRATQ